MRLLHYFFVLCPVPNVACVSELSILDCPFGFLPPLLPCTYYIEVFVPSQENRRSCIYIYVVCMYQGFRVSLYFSIMVINSVSCCVFRKRKDIVKQTGVWFMQVELTNISYIETVFKVRFIQGSAQTGLTVQQTSRLNQIVTQAKNN